MKLVVSLNKNNCSGVAGEEAIPDLRKSESKENVGVPFAYQSREAELWKSVGKWGHSWRAYRVKKV